MGKEDALVIVDVQNDFLSGGKLAVPEGDEVIPVINLLMEQFIPDNIFVTRDAHPKNHKSFAANHSGRKVFDSIVLNGVPQTLWPIHCVVGTKGQYISIGLDLPALPPSHIIDKGTDPEYDSYSGFKDAGGATTGLQKALSSIMFGVDSILYICGLATDYCVKATAIDAAKLGFKVRVVIDACRGVNIATIEQAIVEMKEAGVEIVKSDQILP